MNISIAHSEQTSVGEIQHTFTFEQQEIKALTLLLSEATDLTPAFLELWDHVKHYESATFGVKELMPAIVNKLQKKSQFRDLESHLKNDYSILQGLPKYTWTKNWYARNQLFQIEKILKQNQINFVLLKGIAETFLDDEALTARTCRDIDILIKPQQLSLFTRVVMDLGWFCKDVTPETLLEPQSFAGNAFTFRNSIGIIDLDVHFSGASLNWSANEKFVTQIWLEANKINSELFVPSDQCRLLISAWNLFDVENIKSHQILKYFYDFMRHTQHMSLAEKLSFVRSAESHLKFGSEALRLMIINAQMTKTWSHYVFFSLLLQIIPLKWGKVKIRVSEILYYWLFHTKNIVISRAVKPLSWNQMLFRTIVESDTYQARRNSYLSILKTKKDNLVSYLLSRYWNTKSFLKTNIDRPISIIYTTLKLSILLVKMLVIASLSFLYSCVCTAARSLKKCSFSCRRKKEKKIALQHQGDIAVSPAHPKRAYFVSTNYLKHVQGAQGSTRGWWLSDKKIR